jgi:hypothetical protein
MLRHPLNVLRKAAASPQLRAVAVGDKKPWYPLESPSRRWRILPRALRNEVANVRHQHVATEPRDQRILFILAAARTQITREPHHAVRSVGEGWCAGDHFSGDLEVPPILTARTHRSLGSSDSQTQSRSRRHDCFRPIYFGDEKTYCDASEIADLKQNGGNHCDYHCPR